MLPNNDYKNLPLEFWANIKLLNQRLGYTKRKTKKKPEGGFIIPTVDQILEVFESEGLNPEKLIKNNTLTSFGKQLEGYMKYRGEVLTNEVQNNLMDRNEAKSLFEATKLKLNPSVSLPLPMNKQKGEKRDHAFLTGLVNMLIEANKGTFDCDYDPKELTALTENNFPVRTLSRRVDGAFPRIKDPEAIWEIKEYYYTTTFGSRVADGVYVTQLDGWEVWEAKTNLSREIKHYLIIDGYDTWWARGRSYLCRLVDSMHMGLVTEVIFGKEVVDRIPALVEEWKK